MYESLETFQPFILVGTGAIIGSWMRMHLTNYFGSILPSKYWGTVCVNLAATFFLAFLLAMQSYVGVNSFDNHSPIFLFACVGLLGSLSTFSTFLSDLINSLLDKQVKLCFSLALLSIFGGLALAALGTVSGDV